jgi:UDP-glucose 4-epimerase
MARKQTVLVTGVGDYWGARVAARLVEEPGTHVIGLDREAPRDPIKDLDYIQADVRNPLLVELLRSEGVDAVCHLLFVESERPSETGFDTNVGGTMKVLGACAEAGVGKIILKSSTMVYGAQPDNPAFLGEDSPLRGHPRSGTIRDMVEIEAFCNGFRAQVPGLHLTTLRFPSIVGPTADTPMTRFLHEMWAPVLMGFDPMMQVIHEKDVVGALVHALNFDVPGVFNVAAEGLLPLSQLMALAGKFPIPLFHPLAYAAKDVLAGGPLGSRYSPIEWDYLRYAWVGDLQRMHEQLGYTPRYTGVEALREFAAQQRLRAYLPEKTVLAYDEERLRDTIERRRRAREIEANVMAKASVESEAAKTTEAEPHA